MAMHSDHRTTQAASDGTWEAIWMGAALLVVAAIALWYFSS